MGSINQTHVFFIIVALVAMYGIAEFYYYSPLVPQADLAEANLLTSTGTKTSAEMISDDVDDSDDGYDDDDDDDDDDDESASIQGASQGEAGATSSPSSRPLITYAYSETPNARENLLYFLEQGLHGAADFIFILNGETDAAALIPRRTNVAVVERPNTCYDLGAHGEVLRNNDLWRRYGRFILLNASIRGPFVPYWSQSCWSDAYLGRVTDKVKLVGMTANCFPQFHIQSMIWATDSIGMELLLYPRRQHHEEEQLLDDDENDETPVTTTTTAQDLVALQGCFNEHNRAIGAEVGTTAMIRAAGYEVDALMAAFHKASVHGADDGADDAGYAADCGTEAGAGDVLFDGTYFGSNVHPYETVFIKANRNIDPTTLGLLTDWHRSGRITGSGNGSWDVCV